MHFEGTRGLNVMDFRRELIPLLWRNGIGQRFLFSCRGYEVSVSLQKNEAA